MTSPALPATQVTLTAAPVAWANDVRALLEYYRDTRPSVEVKNSLSLTTAVNGVGDFTTGGGASYAREIDTWTKVSDRLGVPDAGRYLVSLHCLFLAQSGGGRRIQLNTWTATSGGSKSTVDRSIVSQLPHGTVSDYMAVHTEVSLAAGEALAVELFQNSGSAVLATWTLTATLLMAT